jgi:hypothetical protein
MTALSGQTTVTTAGTAVTLGVQAINAPLAVKALASNTAAVYLGSDGLGDVTSATGYELSAGEQIVFDWVASLADILVDAASSGDKVCWLVLSA